MAFIFFIFWGGSIDESYLQQQIEEYPVQVNGVAVGSIHNSGDAINYTPKDGDIIRLGARVKGQGGYLIGPVYRVGATDNPVTAVAEPVILKVEQ